MRQRTNLSLTTALLALLLCLAVPIVEPALAETLRGTVTRVRDGDTLVLRTDAGKRIEVRLNAIDAPEKGGGGVPGQAYAERARAHLESLALRRRASLAAGTTDRYGRRVGVLTVQTPQGEIDAGLWQIRSGMAWVYMRYLDELAPELRSLYRDAESLARKERRGLWRDRSPLPPWEWRVRHPRR